MIANTSIHFGDEEKLIHRLLNINETNKKYTFLVGSGLTSPGPSEPGVSNVDQIIEDISDKLNEMGAKDVLDKELKQVANDKYYQTSMRTLLECQGQDSLNQIISNSVLNARISRTTTLTDGDISLESLEKDIHNWYLRPGVDALGQLFVSYGENFVGPILTSNFDPLIEISIRKHDGTPQTIILPDDGRFTNILSDNAKQVVHFHGYWRGSDTLHTVDQITRDRPKLKGCLRKLLNNTILIVIGYGGWDDIFTSSLIDLVSEGGSNFNVLWTFYSNSEKNIHEKNSKLLKKLSNSIGQRVVLYKGIDCHSVFPKFLEGLPKKIYIKHTKQDEKIKIITEHDFEDNYRKKIYPCDTPPNINKWVGRDNELKSLSSKDFKVTFITGIGGQGKSALASYYIKHIVESGREWELWDWRDCKEEDNRFHTMIISIIERITQGRIRSNQLINESINSLIEIVFEQLGSKKIVFVFDNIDKYIDLVKFVPSRGISILFEKALNREHSSKFIFTCRPAILYSHSDLLQLEIEGLNIDNTIEIFNKYKIPLNTGEINELAKTAHGLTNGHPLWLSLIAAQALRGKKTVLNFIKGIKRRTDSIGKDVSSVLAENTLKTVWDTLNRKQQILLRFMSETVKAETENNLSEIIKPELNYNQFSKALKTLNNLNLIVVKSSPNEPDLLELHPLVKEFIKHKYPMTERSKYIALFVNHFNRIILVLKPQLSHDSPLYVFENWTHKIELEINKRDFKNALISLQEISKPIRTAGYIEEFLRVCHMFYIEVDWPTAITEEYSYFHSQFYNFVKIFIELGRYNDADTFLKKYSRSISGKGIHYLFYCDLTCYYYWYKEDFTNAIIWGEKGSDLKLKYEIDTNFDPTHNLALALRDSRMENNLTKALNYFLLGEVLEDVLADKLPEENFSGSFYGNIGRCLQFQGNSEDALWCYKKSLKLLMAESTTRTQINIGYACKWIAEILSVQEDYTTAYIFNKKAYIQWKELSPPRAKTIEIILTDIIQADKVTTDTIKLNEWQIEKHFNDWLSI